MVLDSYLQSPRDFGVTCAGNLAFSTLSDDGSRITTHEKTACVKQHRAIFITINMCPKGMNMVG